MEENTGTAEKSALRQTHLYSEKVDCQDVPIAKT